MNNLTIKEYIDYASRTAKKHDATDNYNENYKQQLDHYAMGVAEESSELLSLIYDHFYNDAWLDTRKVIDEMGDCLWYHTMLAQHINYIGTGVLDSKDGFCAFVHNVTGFPHKRFSEITNQDSHLLNEDESREKQLLKYSIDASVNAGKVLSKIKKVVHFNHSLDVDKISKFHEDSFHSMLRLCMLLDIDIEEVAQTNVDKLKVRYPDGFTDQASINRLDLINE